MNPSTGKKVLQLPTDHGVASGVTTTAGGLVFTTTTDGTVYALDDETLKPLWSFNTGSFSSAPPMTYAVNGKQYVAVLIGTILPFRRSPLGAGQASAAEISRKIVAGQPYQADLRKR
jgi:outer membrane protein assembly factor BamB